MGDLMIFCPNGSTVTLSVNNGASSRVALPTLDPICGAVRIIQSGTPATYIAFGDSTVTASSSDMLLGLEKNPQIFRVPAGATHIAGNGSSVVLYITAGQI